jgi:hypothetical protein
MNIESSNDPQNFLNFELDGWETVSQGYEEYFAKLTRQSVEAILDAAHGRDHPHRVSGHFAAPRGSLPGSIIRTLSQIKTPLRSCARQTSGGKNQFATLRID